MTDFHKQVALILTNYCPVVTPADNIRHRLAVEAFTALIQTLVPEERPIESLTIDPSMFHSSSEYQVGEFNGFNQCRAQILSAIKGKV